MQAQAIREAAERAAAKLDFVASRLDRAGSGAAVLEAQALMLRDTSLLDAVCQAMDAGLAVAEAVASGAEGFAGQMEALDDPYLKERAGDIREAGRLLLIELAGAEASRLAHLRQPSVVVARELSPADTLSADRSLLLALVTEAGGRNSHAAIVARELNIPAVVGAKGALAAARSAVAAEVDGDRGEVRLFSSSSMVTATRARAGKLSLDKVFVPILGNAGSVDSVRSAAAVGAQGIGLFRTEFLFLERSHAPSEVEQAEIYATVCESMAPHPVIVRTLDTGSDKALPYLPGDVEANPALGRRGVRLWLRHAELWEPQVRALVSTGSKWPNLLVMVPMIASPDEMATVRAMFASEAQRQGTVPPSLGMMVELPAVAVGLTRFAKAADFFSIGTNDLTQYALGADREIEWDHHLTEFNPGVLRLIAQALSSARRMGAKIGVCGEMAGLPEGAIFLAGMGAASLSMATSCMPQVSECLTRLGHERCYRAARQALRASSATQVLARLRAADN